MSIRWDTRNKRWRVGQVLGHKDQRSTARYSHLLAETLGAAVGMIGRRRA